MDITTMKHIAPSDTRRERSARPQMTHRLVAPVCASFQGTTLPVASLVGLATVAPWGVDVLEPATGAHAGSNAMTYTSIDALTFRRGRPPS